MNHPFGCQIFSSRIGRLFCANNAPRCSVPGFCEFRGPKTQRSQCDRHIITPRPGARSNRISEEPFILW